MANTIDADLLIDTLSNRVKTTLGPALAPLNSFTRDFSTDVYVLGKSHQIPVTTGGSTTLVNPTNFEQGDSTTDNIPVTVDHYSQPFHVTSAQLNQRIKLEQLVDKNLQTLGNKLLDAAMAPITAANFANQSGLIAQADIAVTDLQAGWGTIADSPIKNAILDGIAYSKFLPTSQNSFTLGRGAYGFDGFFLNTRWSGAEAGTYGFICGPDAIAQASGIPEIHPAVKRLLMESKTVTIENLGLTVQMNVWGSVSSRTVWASFDLFYGASYGKDGAKTGYRIRSA